MKYNFEYCVGNRTAIIYRSGMVRFKKEAVLAYGLEGACLKWGVDKEKNVIAFKKVLLGRKVRKGNSYEVTCPKIIALNYAGKYAIEEHEGEFVLKRLN